MRLPILAGAVATLLAGCADTMAPGLSGEQASLAPACKRGAVDSERIFLLCPDSRDVLADATRSLEQTTDPALDIASVAADYGIARQSVTGIEAATYSRIVARIPEVRARSTRVAPIVIGGRDFRKVALVADGRAPSILFIEK